MVLWPRRLGARATQGVHLLPQALASPLEALEHSLLSHSVLHPQGLGFPARLLLGSHRQCQPLEPLLLLRLAQLPLVVPLLALALPQLLVKAAHQPLGRPQLLVHSLHQPLAKLQVALAPLKAHQPLGLRPQIPLGSQHLLLAAGEAVLASAHLNRALQALVRLRARQLLAAQALEPLARAAHLPLGKHPLLLLVSSRACRLSPSILEAPLELPNSRQVLACRHQPLGLAPLPQPLAAPLATLSKASRSPALSTLALPSQALVLSVARHLGLVNHSPTASLGRRHSQALDLEVHLGSLHLPLAQQVLASLLSSSKHPSSNCSPSSISWSP